MERTDQQPPLTFYCARPACRVQLSDPHADLPSTLSFARDAGWQGEDRCPACAQFERLKEALERNPPTRDARVRLAREGATRLRTLSRTGHARDGAPFYLLSERWPHARADAPPDYWAFAMDVAPLKALVDEPAADLRDVCAHAVDALLEDSDPSDRLTSRRSWHRYASLAMSGQRFEDLDDALKGGMAPRGRRPVGRLVLAELDLRESAPRASGER